MGGNHKVPLAPLATRAGHSWEQQEEHEERKFQELGAKNASLLWKKRRRSIYIAFPALLFAENSSHPQSCQATAGKKQIPFLAQSATSESLVAPIKLLKSLSSAEVKPLKQSQILSLGLRCCRRGWLDCTPHLPSRSISEKWALAPHCPWQTLAILRVQGNQEYKGIPEINGKMNKLIIDKKLATILPLTYLGNETKNVKERNWLRLDMILFPA